MLPAESARTSGLEDREVGVGFLGQQGVTPLPAEREQGIPLSQWVEQCGTI